MRTISASSMIGIVPIALHDGMIGGAAPAANESLRAGHSKTISDSAVKAVLAVARVIQRRAHRIVKNVQMVDTKCRDEVSCARTAGASL